MKLPRNAVDRVVADFSNLPGDPRRRQRVEKVVARVARAPAATLPVAMDGDAAEIEGAYRLMRSDALSFEVLAAAHAEGTRQRVAEEGGDIVLVLHDTTTCSFSRLPPSEIGYLQTGKAGFLLHMALVVDAKKRRPLGVIHAETIVRKRRTRGVWKTRPSGSATTGWRDRESLRWARGLETTARLLTGRRVINIADRESDSYALMAQAIQRGQSLVFRVRTDRRGRLPDDVEWSKVKEIASSCEGVFEREVPLSRRRGKTAPRASKANPARDARVARLQFAATTVVIPRPNYLGAPWPPTLTVNVVHVLEVGAPRGEEPVEWFLYTTEPIATTKEIEFIVDTYRARWTVEEFFAALKTGCAYEERRFESLHALTVMLALSLPVACEVLWLRAMSRAFPDAPATDVLTDTQINVLRALSPRQLPAWLTAEVAMLAVAGLGGHMRSNGPPGWKTLSRGMTKVISSEAAWEAAQRTSREM